MITLIVGLGCLIIGLIAGYIFDACIVRNPTVARLKARKKKSDDLALRALDAYEKNIAYVYGQRR